MIEKIDITIDTLQKTVVQSNWRDQKSHMAPFCRLYLITNGSGCLETRGKLWNLKKGHCYLLDTRHPLRLIDSPQLEHYWIHFRSTIFGGLSLFNFYICPVEMKCKRPELFDAMLDIYPPKTVADAVRLQGMFRLIFSDFLEQGSLLWNTRAYDMERFHGVLQYISQNLSEDISIEKLARLTHLHPNYFSNIFARTFGLSPQQYILQRRIQKAQMLLWNTNLPIAEIGLKVGYEDNCYFSRIFKKNTGVTPIIYRRQKNFDLIK